MSENEKRQRNSQEIEKKHLSETDSGYVRGTDSGYARGNESGYSQGMEKIDLINMLDRFFDVFKHMVLQVIIIAILFAGIFYIKARITYTPMYSAFATYIVNIQEETSDGTQTAIRYYDNEVAQQIVSTFPYILTSDVLRRRVAEELGATGITSTIQATVAENTNFLTITVTDKDPQKAYATLQAVLKNYPEISELIIGRVYLELLDETGVPTTVNNPLNATRSAIKGGLLGLIVALCWVAILAFLRRTIRREKDVFKLLHIRCLAVIPTIIGNKHRRKAKENTTFLNPKFEDQLKEPFMQMRNKVKYYAKKYNMKTFIVTSALAGEGKSTIAVNLALSLAADNKRVALIDCDIRHPSDRGVLGLEPGKGLSEILLGEANLSECLMNAEKMGLEGNQKIIFVPGGRRVNEGAELLGNKRMKMIIDYLAERVDYVILDSAPASLLTDAVVLSQYAEAAIIVARRDFASVDHIFDGMEHLAEGNVRIIGAVLNDAT